MPFTQAHAAKIFPFFLEPQPLFLDNVRRRHARPGIARHPRDRLGKNNNGCAESRIRAQAGSRSGTGARPAHPPQSPAAHLLPGRRPILQHHDVCGDGAVRHHLLSSSRIRQPAGHDAASRRDDLGVSGGAADAAHRPEHRLPRRFAVRHGGRHRDVHRTVHRQLPRHVRRRSHPRLRGSLPADVPLRRGGTGADPLPRQGDFMGDRRRRRRRRDRTQPRARDARSDDAALRRDLCRHSRPARHRLYDHVFHHLPIGRARRLRPRARPTLPCRRVRCWRSRASRASSRRRWPACWRSARCPSS